MGNRTYQKMIVLSHHIDYPDFTPIDRALCGQCGSECCDSSTPFTKEDIANIKKKYRKLLRGVELIFDGDGVFTLRKRSNEQCVFLDQNKRCKIYDIRPQICRDFGDKPWCLCAYNGLSAIPSDPKILAHLASEAQRLNTERLAAGMGIQLQANMIDPGAENVLSNNQRRKTLDFRKEA